MGAPSLLRNLKLRRYIAGLKAEWNVLDMPYLRSLRDGSFEREDFLETQVHFFAAVAHFSRPMAILASRLPRPDQRLPLVENMFDEHGRGNLGHGHERTFLVLLERLGVEVGRAGRTPWPEVRAFNAALTGLAAFDTPLTGLAVFGIIEDLFSGISLELGRGIVARGWLEAEEVTHYPTHATLDEEHADGFYRQLDGPYGEDPRTEVEIEQGLVLGGHLFLRLYEDLYRARGRRD